MSMQYRAARGLWVFLLRNAVLYFLLVNAYLHLRGDLSLVFLSTGFVSVIVICRIDAGKSQFLISVLKKIFWFCAFEV